MARFDKDSSHGARRTGDDRRTASKGGTRSPQPSRLPVRDALIIFTKAPIPGEVKTRLCPPLVPDEAATLHGSLVLDVLERTRLSGIDRYVAGAPAADHVFFKILEARHDVKLLSQQGADLGARMQHAFSAVLDYGYQKAVLIGTDVPVLSGSLVSEAFALLESHDVVLGPALDGGYYLIGLTRLVPDLFMDMAWSSDRICAVTQDRARSLGLRVALLPSHRDLDTVDDVLALAEEARLEARDARPEEDARSSNSESRTLALSKRTAGVLHNLADRIRSRTPNGRIKA
jgi:rSAM/selenodomain-associated transferase 1